jgi:hypothetical protein
MNIIAIIMFLVKYGPTIWSLVSEIGELIKKLRDKDERKLFEAELKTAAAHYKTNKDRRRLEALRDRLRKRCFGDNCPVQ